MQVIKRDGNIKDFNIAKIHDAVSKVNDRTQEMTEDDIARITTIVTNKCQKLGEEKIRVETIQDIVEDTLLKSKFNKSAKSYILYREKRTQARGSVTDKTFMEFLSGKSDYWNNENSNKDAKVVTTQRDYLAGIASTDLTRRFLLPEDVRDAHDAGIIHQHDMDYMAQKALNNCCLINLEDMLQNGTVINSTKIDPQHRLLTATTVATQIITAVASSQYGGTTITLSHLAPFVRMSHDYYVKKYKERGLDIVSCLNYAAEDIKTEIKDAVQTFNYQINSMSTTNGQAPFLSVAMYIAEDPEYSAEVAMLTEEFLKQRILGMKNEQGVYVTPAFPKLLYVLDEDNITPDSKYWYLTELAAKCTARRMVPDYISAKVLIREKYGIDNKTGLVVPGYEMVFKKMMLNMGYSESEIDEEIKNEIKLQESKEH